MIKLEEEENVGFFAFLALEAVRNIPDASPKKNETIAFNRLKSKSHCDQNSGSSKKECPPLDTLCLVLC
jgi:hypothetical protein